MRGLPCPHCHAPAKVRTSEQLSPLLRKSWLCCQNLECGHTFVTFTEFCYTLSPSATPRPGLALPLSPHVQRKDLEESMRFAPDGQDPAPAPAADPPP